MSEVFLSYSRSNSPAMEYVLNALSQQGRDVWVDQTNLPFAADWWREIQRGIDAAHTVVFIISEESLASPVCHLEIAHARSANKRLVPLMFGDFEPEEALDALQSNRLTDAVRSVLAGRDMMEVARENWVILSRLNWIFFKQKHQYDKSIRQLVKTLNTDLVYVEMHTRLNVRAQEWQEHQNSASYLLRGDDLVKAEQWLANSLGKEPAPTKFHNDYIFASRQAETRTQRRLLTATSVGLVITVLLTIFAFTQQALATAAEARAQQNADVARSQAQAAEAQIALSADNPELAMLLGLEAVQVQPPPPQAQRVLGEAIYRPGSRRVFGGHSSSVNVVAVSPDNRWLATAGFDLQIIIWDVATGAQIRRCIGHTDEVNDVIFSPDGHYLLSASSDQSIIVWDVTNCAVLRTFTEHGESVRHLAISPDGQWVASNGGETFFINGDLLLWELETGSIRWRFEGQVNSTDFSPDGTRLIVVEDFYLSLLDAASGDILIGTTAHNNAITAVDFSPDGATVLTASADTRLILWDVRDLTETRRLSGHTDRINSVAFSPDGSMAVSAASSFNGTDGSLILWDIKTGVPLRRYKGHSSNFFGVIDVTFSADGHHLLSAAQDQTARMWDIENGAVIHRLDGHNSIVTSVAYHPDGRTILSGSSVAGLDFDNLPGEMILWDAVTGQVLRRYEGHTNTIASIAFSPDGRFALSGSWDGTMILWDLNVSDPIVRQYEGHTDQVWSVAFSPDGLYAASGSIDKSIVLWDLNSDQPLMTRLELHEESVLSIAYSPDGRLLLSGSEDGSVILWDVASRTALRRFHSGAGHVGSVTFNGDGTQALFGLSDNSILRWDIATWTQVGVPLLGHESGFGSGVNSVAFSRDMRFALSGGNDATVILWDLSNNSAVRRFEGHRDTIRAVAFAPDGHSAVSASVDSDLLIWRIDSLEDMIGWLHENRYLREFTCNERIQFVVTRVCNSAGDSPTRTPYPTLMPTLTFTPSPTVDSLRTTLTPTHTPTSTPLPTRTPRLNPTDDGLPTETLEPLVAMPIERLHERMTELDLVFEPMLPTALPEGVFYYGVTPLLAEDLAMIPNAAEAGFLIVFSTDPNLSRADLDAGNFRDSILFIQTISPYTQLSEWTDALGFTAFAQFQTLGATEVAAFGLEGSFFFAALYNDIITVIATEQVDPMLGAVLLDSMLTAAGADTGS